MFAFQAQYNIYASCIFLHVGNGRVYIRLSLCKSGFM